MLNLLPFRLACLSTVCCCVLSQGLLDMTAVLAAHFRHLVFRMTFCTQSLSLHKYTDDMCVQDHRLSLQCNG